MAGSCVTLTILMCGALLVVVGVGTRPVMDLDFLSEGERIDKLHSLLSNS